MKRAYRAGRRGFTLVEMLVIAPIVILTIGSFIALIVSLTGEVLSSRGANTLTYNVQDALNRIESDVKMSTTFLATNNISFSSTASPGNPANPQGYGANNSIEPFRNVGASEGQMLILNGLVTDGDPLKITTSTVYLANQPNSCTDPSDPLAHTKNRPLSMNIIYFTDSDGTLWRRTVLPANYAEAGIRCGTNAIWQQPSCGLNYTSPFCKTNDVKLVEGVGTDGLSIEYFTAAGAPTSIAAASNPAETTNIRSTALQSATTASVTLTSKRTIAGRDISRTGSLKATRLDTNATSIAMLAPPTAAPAIPVVSSNVSEGHHVTFTWPRVATATGYDVQYRINGTATWTTVATTFGSNDRSFTFEGATHTDTVEARVFSKNSAGTSTAGSRSTTIPQWAPLSLENGWTDYGPPYATPSYTKTKAGVVLLRGLVKNANPSLVPATLPAGYRPSNQIMFISSSNQAIARLDIKNDGRIELPVGSPLWFALDNIAFMPSEASFTVMTPLTNGWVSYGVANPQWERTGYTTDSAGRVHIRGLISGGATADNTNIYTVPAALRPSEYTHWVQQNGNSVGAIGYNPATTSFVSKTGNGNGYVSMSIIYYPAARVDGSDCTTAWCTLPLASGWVHYGSTFTTPRYTKGSDGMVQMKGLIRAGTNANITGTTSSTSIPSAYCPKSRLIMTVLTADTWGRVDVVPQADGTCFLQGSAYNTAWVSLDSIRYMAE